VHGLQVGQGNFWACPLQTSLKNINTPQLVVDCIMHGFTAWLHPSQRHSAPTAGSVHPLHIMLTQAYHEQFYKVGWYQLCLGRISKKWSKVINLQWGPTTPKSNTEYWASHFIMALWQWMWKHWNQLVHRHSCQEKAKIMLHNLHTQVSDHYAAYHNDSSYVLPRHNYLFKQRSLEDRLKQSYDYIKCWLHSVDEAQDILKFQLLHLRETSASFFAPFHRPENQTSLSSEEDSYLPSRQEDVTYIANTHDTLSLTDFSISTPDSDSDGTTSSKSSASSTVYIQPVHQFPKW